MTTITADPITRPRDPAVATSPITLRRVLRSEAFKLTSLRSTWMWLTGILVALIGFGTISALTSSGQVESVDGQAGPPGFGGGDPVSVVLSGAQFAVLLIAALGAVVGAREYSSGMIRTTMAAVPRRLPVLWAKLGAFLGILTPVLVTGVLVAFFVGNAVLQAGDAESAAWSDPGVARAVLGTAAYLAALSAIGVALGVLLRSTTGGVATVIGAVLVAPTLASALLPDSWDAALKYLPSNAGLSFTSVTPDPTLLDATTGAWVLLAWVVVAVGAAALAVRRRDV